jgi:hypothetical protein
VEAYGRQARILTLSRRRVRSGFAPSGAADNYSVTGNGEARTGLRKQSAWGKVADVYRTSSIRPWHQ